jgi:hypothetical protein
MLDGEGTGETRETGRKELFLATIDSAKLPCQTNSEYKVTADYTLAKAFQ